MCGIAGIASREANPQHAPAAENMAAAIRHRGPDGSAVRDCGSCVLASTRLAIVDLSARGAMPMCNEDSTVWITYNGECYNADELRPQLAARGHQFRSSSDTEVVLHLYEEYGERCVEKLRGMFAFAIWDARATASASNRSTTPRLQTSWYSHRKLRRCSLPASFLANLTRPAFAPSCS